MGSKNLIVVAGPTAVGKTALAIRLAKHFKTEIISADSRQIYRELELGTAKPSKEELTQVKHHFVNSRSINEDYDAGKFGVEAREIIDILFKQNDVIVMCGGSGLYIKAVVEGFDDLPEVAAGTRESINEEYKQKGLDWLQKQVEESDPDYFEIVDKRNPQRLIRALEMIRTTGKPFSEFRKKENIVLPFNVIKIGLELDRDELYKRIDDRMDKMIGAGLLDEAKKFFTQRHLNSLQTVGYQEVFEYLDGKYDRDEAIRLMKRNTRHYAKRQFTWFKKDAAIRWFHPYDWDKILREIEEKIKNQN